MLKFEKLSKLSKYGAAISFLAMEIFAMIAFSFGNNYVLYGSLALALAVLLILFNIKEITVDGVSSIAFFFLPLFLFTVITAFGAYSRTHLYIGDYNLAELIFIPLGILPMSFIGYMLSVDKTFKISTFLLVIYAALGILVLINLGVNLVNFGAFYPIIYKGYHMYYGGVMSEVTIDEMAYALEGFKFIEVKIEHYILYPVLLLSSSAALFFVSPREHKKTFIFYCITTFAALISLILVPSKLSIFGAAIILVIDVVIFLMKKFTKARRPFLIALNIIIGLGVLGYLFMILNQQSNLPLHNLVASNSFLNKLFNANRIVDRYNPLIENVFSGDKFLGFAVYSKTLLDEAHMSGSFLFDFFMTSGVIGVVAFLFALVIGFRGFSRYFKSNNDDLYVKAVLIAFVLMYLAFTGTFDNTEYGIFYDIYKPIFMTGPFMIMVFIFSYVLAKNPKKENDEKPVIEESKSETEGESANEEI